LLFIAHFAEAGGSAPLSLQHIVTFLGLPDNGNGKEIYSVFTAKDGGLGANYNTNLNWLETIKKLALKLAY